MKTVILLRHAEAAPQPANDDYSRPLTPRGHKECAQLLEQLHHFALPAPERILCSSSKRTTETWLNIAPAWPLLAPNFTDELYLADQQSLFSVLQSLPDALNSVMLIGHNPGMHQLAHYLLSPLSYQTSPLHKGFPTCGLAVLHFPMLEWKDIHPQTAQCSLFLHHVHSYKAAS